MTLSTDHSNKTAYHNSKISPPPNSQSEHQLSQVGKVNSKHRHKSTVIESTSLHILPSSMIPLSMTLLPFKFSN